MSLIVVVGVGPHYMIRELKNHDKVHDDDVC